MVCSFGISLIVYLLNSLIERATTAAVCIWYLLLYIFTLSFHSFHGFGKLASVTEPTRREAYVSMCKFLFINIVNTQAGSNNGKQIWHGQDTRVILGQAWVDDRRTISNRARQRDNPGTQAIVQNGGTNRVRTARQRVNPGNMGKNQNTQDKTMTTTWAP